MLVYDLESDGLLRDDPNDPNKRALTAIHCIVIYDTTSKTWELYDPENKPIELGVKRLMAASKTCGHNIIGYDEHALAAMYDWYTPPRNSLDTMVMARLLNPTIKDGDYARARKGMLPGRLIGSHSLEAYGYRMGEYKGDYGATTDWQHWEPAKTTYCKQDVKLTVQLLERLKGRPGWGTEAVDIEHDFQRFIVRQMNHGVRFDEPHAHTLVEQLRSDLKTTHETISTMCPSFIKRKGTKKTALFVPKRDNKRLGYVAGAPMTKIQHVEFNPASGAHISRFLVRKYDWKPTEFTPKSNEPKIDDDILAALPYPECEHLSQYMLIKKRLGQVIDGQKAWFNYLEPDGYIRGYVNSCGAITNRCTHSHPNLAQVPTVRAPYGTECRRCFVPTPGRLLVGCDAKGLEVRLLAHFMNDPEYIAVVLSSDPHQRNADILGLDRDTAKKWFYEFIYGAGNALLGKGDAKKGAWLRAKLLKGLPALQRLVDGVKQQVEINGWIHGLAGQHLYSRSPHSALNLQLQSAGAYVMKKAACLVDARLDWTRCAPVLNIHDELQIEADEDYTETVGQTCQQAIVDSGLHFQLNIPMDADFKIGRSWAETH